MDKDYLPALMAAIAVLALVVMFVLRHRDLCQQYDDLDKEHFYLKTAVATVLTEEQQMQIKEQITVLQRQQYKKGQSSDKPIN